MCSRKSSYFVNTNTMSKINSHSENPLNKKCRWRLVTWKLMQMYAHKNVYLFSGGRDKS